MRSSLHYSPHTPPEPFDEDRVQLFEALKGSMDLVDSRDLGEQALNIRLAFQNFLDLADLVLPDRLSEPGRVLDLLEPCLNDFSLELKDREVDDEIIEALIDDIQLRVYFAFAEDLLERAREDVPNYLRYAPRRPRLSPDHEMALIRGLHHEGEDGFKEQAQELLFYQYVNLIRTLARRVVRHYPDFLDAEDLIQDGLCEFFSALDRHQPEHGLVSTYIKSRTWARLGRAVHLYIDTVSLPERKRKAVNQLIQGHWRLATQLLRDPSWAEVAEFLGWSLDKVHKVRGWSLAPDSLCFDGPEIRERPLAMERSRSTDAEVAVLLRELRAQLTPEEDEIIVRIDLFGESSADVAPDFARSSARIRQIRGKALLKLRAFVDENAGR